MLTTLRDDPLLSDVPEIDGFKVLEPCVLYSKLGEGGMGAVYRGRHLNLGIDVAVKCLRRSLAEGDSIFVQRFQREAQLAAGIHHQNLVQVYDVLQKSNVHYLVMEYVSGETARDRVRRKGPLAVNEALRIALGAAGGLAVAHARKIVHRDVKPDNVLIARDGSVKVSDLGLAKAMESEVEVRLTQGVMGTPQYMAPEQWEDTSGVTPAADVWALGATIWFLLAGDDPIPKGTFRQVMKKVCDEPFPDIRARRDDVSDDAVRLIERCVARDPAERFAHCGEVLAELQRFVGRDEGELVSKPGEETRMGRSLVSPPPAETLERIRSEVYPRAKPKSEVLPKTLEPSETIPMRGAPPPRPRRKRWVWIAAGSAAAVLLALGAYLASRGGTGPPSPDPRPPSPPADPRSTHATLDQVDDLRKGYVSGTRKFRLTGKVDGSLRGVRASIADKQGRVDLDDLKDGRFALDLDFARDGTYTLELEGEKLLAPKTLAITVDTTGPRLVDHREDPRPPLARGKETEITLEFDEALKSAVIGGDTARIKDRTARASLDAPERDASWTVAWRAVDRLDHASSGSLDLKLVSLPAPPREDEQKSDPPIQPQEVDHSKTALPGEPPAGCDAVGNDVLDLGGRRWAKRVRHQRTGIVLVLIPRGSFTMGSRTDGENAPAPRTVSLVHDFYMSENEVSNAEYGRVERAKSSASDLPVVGLKASEADEFCHDARLELPTEAEWEYACRAGSDHPYAFGESLSSDQASTAAQGMVLRPCGTSMRNAFGLADMHGNAKEFCADTYLAPAEYLGLSPQDPVGKKGKLRVLRGGSYASLPALCTSSARGSVDPSRVVPDGGLRVILRID